jgi:hypothetical protein
MLGTQRKGRLTAALGNELCRAGQAAAAFSGANKCAQPASTQRESGGERNGTVLADERRSHSASTVSSSDTVPLDAGLPRKQNPGYRIHDPRGARKSRINLVSAMRSRSETATCRDLHTFGDGGLLLTIFAGSVNPSARRSQSFRRMVLII